MSVYFENELSDLEIINHARWLIDHKLNYLSSFRSRTMEILGLNSAIMIFMWSQLDNFLGRNESKGFSEFFLITMIFLYSFLVVMEIFIFLYVSIPRKSEVSLELPQKFEDIKTNLQNYDSQISKYVGSRARATRMFFRMFIVQVLLIMMVLISTPNLVEDWLRYIIILILSIIALVVTLTKEKLFNSVIEKIDKISQRKETS